MNNQAYGLNARALFRDVTLKYKTAYLEENKSDIEIPKYFITEEEIEVITKAILNFIQAYPNINCDIDQETIDQIVKTCPQYNLNEAQALLKYTRIFSAAFKGAIDSALFYSYSAITWDMFVVGLNNLVSINVPSDKIIILKNQIIAATKMMKRTRDNEGVKIS